MIQKWDVVIIGGGLAGLVAANYLSERDLSILLLEKGNKLGGRARTDQIHQQYFNLGPHALYKKGKAKSILEELCIQTPGKSPTLGGILVKDHFKYSVPFSPLNLFTTRFLNWKERIELVKVLLKVMSTNTEKLAQQSFEKWVLQISDSVNIRDLLFLLGRLATYCHAPDKASARIIVSHLKTVMSGVYYLDYGWQTIIDQLHTKAVTSGVKVQTHMSIKNIIPTDQDLFKLVSSTGEEIYSKNIVCTTGPHELNQMLGYSEIEAFVNMTPVLGSTYDIALTKLPNPKLLFAMGITDPIYFSVHSKDARLSEDAKSVVLHLFKYHQPDERIDAKKIKTDLEQFLETLQPGWKLYEITSRFIPQITVNQRLPQIGDEEMLRCSKIQIPGLYIAGDWACSNSILSEAAVCSGKQAALEIIKKEKG